MTFSYMSPDASDKDTVRFLIQDTNSDEPFLQDEEIAWLITKWKDVYGTMEMVAAMAADTIAARYAREASISADGVNVGLGQVAQQFRDLAVSLRQQHKNLLVGGLPDVGGVSPYEGQAHDIAPFNFGTGMHDDLEAGLQDYGSRNSRYYVAEHQPGE
jgi:hypothetical protein